MSVLLIDAFLRCGAVLQSIYYHGWRICVNPYHHECIVRSSLMCRNIFSFAWYVYFVNPSKIFFYLCEARCSVLNGSSVCILCIFYFYCGSAVPHENSKTFSSKRGFLRFDLAGGKKLLNFTLSLTHSLRACRIFQWHVILMLLIVNFLTILRALFFLPAPGLRCLQAMHTRYTPLRIIARGAPARIFSPLHVLGDVASRDR